METFYTSVFEEIENLNKSFDRLMLKGNWTAERIFKLHLIPYWNSNINFFLLFTYFGACGAINLNFLRIKGKAFQLTYFNERNEL